MKWGLFFPGHLSLCAQLSTHIFIFALVCKGDLPTKQIKCFYSDALWQLPTFVRHSSDSASDWSVDLRCKNFTSISWFNVRVEELNLERNQLMLMENTGWLETVGLARLYLRSNQLLQVDVGFLVHLSHLDVSDNRLHQFSIEFYSMAQQRNNEQRSVI